MKKHFIVFLSPGTFFSETTIKPIKSWDVKTAVKMADNIIERHRATPYGFYFITKEREKNELDSHITKKSGTYFLGGEILTIEDVKKENNPKNKTLISNMVGNGWKKIVRNTNSWLIHQPLLKEDTVLDYTPPKRGFS